MIYFWITFRLRMSTFPHNVHGINSDFFCRVHGNRFLRVPISGFSEHFYSIFQLWVFVQYGPFLTNIDRSLTVVFVQYGPFRPSLRLWHPPFKKKDWENFLRIWQTFHFFHRQVIDCRFCPIRTIIGEYRQVICRFAATHVWVKNPQIKN